MLDFTTGAIPRRDRADQYSRVLSSYYTDIGLDRDVRAEIHENDVLEAVSLGFGLGKLSCSIHRCNSPLHRYSMRQGSPQTGYSLQYIKEGSLTIISDDYELRVQPGDMIFIRPHKVLEYHVSAGGSETVGVHVPLALVNAISYGRSIALDRVFDGKSGIGACVASLVDAIFSFNSGLSRSDSATLQISLAEAIVQLGTSGIEDASVSTARADLLSHLKSLAAAALDDPELSPAQIADLAGVSVRTLHRAFQGSGETFWSWICDQRLERCHMELTAPGLARRSITEVAFRWGFNELSTFDRNFRKRYGAPPRVIRAKDGVESADLQKRD